MTASGALLVLLAREWVLVVVFCVIECFGGGVLCVCVYMRVCSCLRELVIILILLLHLLLVILGWW